MPATRTFAALLLLAGCAGSADWTKPGTDPAQVATALQQCHAAAQQAVDAEEKIDEDIAMTRGADWDRSQIGGLARTELGAETRRRSDRIVASCMRADGFRAAR
jgi:hypothetical protein